MPFFVLVMLGLLFLAWRCDGVWVLSEMAANHLGVFIAIGAAGWILFQIPRSEEELVTGVNWPAGLLPHLGPLLMILLVVKLFRPKRLPDYWVIQTMGLMMVTLAAVLADEHIFGLFVILYLASLVWSLAVYYPVRERALTGFASRRRVFREPHSLIWRCRRAPASALAVVGAAAGGAMDVHDRAGRLRHFSGGAAPGPIPVERAAVEHGLRRHFQKRPTQASISTAPAPSNSPTIRLCRDGPRSPGPARDPAVIGRWRRGRSTCTQQVVGIRTLADGPTMERRVAADPSS